MAYSRVGVMRSAMAGTGAIHANDAAERALAHAIFGTPVSRRTMFREPHGLLWGIVELLWPRSNFVEVWVDLEPSP